MDPPCAEPDKLHAWLANKKIGIRLLYYKVDFEVGYGYPFFTRLNELWLKTLPMKAGRFSDVGYRMRLNFFEKADRWYPWVAFLPLEPYYFYDYVYYNADVFKVPEDQTAIAEIYWRLSGD